MSPEQDPITLATILRWVGEAFGALALWMVRVMHLKWTSAVARLDALEAAHKALPIEFVSRDTHQRHERDVHDQLAEMQTKADGREDRILKAIAALDDKLGKRIDTLFQRPDR